MKAMILRRPCSLEENRFPLEMVDLPVPLVREGELLLKISACGVCHTELDEIEGRTLPSEFPIVLGHQIVGRVEGAAGGTKRFSAGDRVGVAWIYSACGKCRFCMQGMENLCDGFRATGRDADGGYAEYTVVPEGFVYRIPGAFSDAEAAPLLCAGAIGYRALRLTGMQEHDNLGLTGFGASAHLVLKMAKHRFPGAKVFVFSRTEGERRFALELGADWAGDLSDEPPERMNSIIDTTPAWTPVVEALKKLEKGGRLVINAIRKEAADKDSLSGLDYSRDLWLEKEIKSVANITRRDVEEFLQMAADVPITPDIEEYPLEEANRALLELKERKIRGAKVLRIG